MAKSKRGPADELRSVPPRDFVAARTALAARLTEQGDAQEARRVARLRRPSPVTWALNRAATARPRELAALGEAVDRLRRAQLGRGDLRAATEGYRSAFEPLVRAAREALEGAGTKVSAGPDRRLRSTLLAAVTDRALRADLAAGRLEGEHADPGFAVLAGGPVPAAFLRDRPRSARATPTTPAPAARTAKTGAAETGDEAPRASRPDRRAVRRAAREAARRQQAARRAERAAQAAERRVSAMRQSLAALEERSAALRAAADQARTAALSPGTGEPARPTTPREGRR